MTVKNRKRVAVFVDNFCIRDSRVIKSAEAMAAKGYEIRVFCRDSRTPIGDETINGVRYQRNWIGTLYYAQSPRVQLDCLGIYLFRIPGTISSKLSFCIKIFLLIVAYSLKFLIDIVRKKRKDWHKTRNKKAKYLRNQHTKKVRKMRRSKSKLKRLSEYPLRLVFKIKRIFHRNWQPFVFATIGLIFAIILAIPGMIFGLVVVLSIGWVLLNQFIQAIGQPGMNVAQSKAAENAAKKATLVKRRLHSRLLHLLLDDKSDEVYVNRVTKYRAARIYEAIRESVIEFKPDLIHAHDLVNLPVGYLLGSDTGAKVIYDAHELETARDKPSHKRWKKAVRKLEGHFSKKVDAIVTVSSGLAEEIARVHNVSMPTIIYNTPSLSDAAPAVQNIRQELGLSNKTPLALYVGGLKISRGLPFFLEAIVEIPDMHFVACGPRTEKAESDFSNLVERLGISDRSHLVGPVDQKYLLDYIRPADFSIMPTQNIGLSYIYALPNKFFESMFANIPILVGSDIIEMATIVEQQKVGKLVVQNDPEDIARVMREFIEEKSTRKIEGRETALASIFGWQSQVIKLSRLYSTLLNEELPYAMPKKEAVSA